MKTQNSKSIERYCRYRRETDPQWQRGEGSSGDPRFCRGEGPNGSVDRETCRYMELSGCYWGDQPLTTPIFCNDVECTQGDRNAGGNSYPLSTCNIDDILSCPPGYRDDGIFVPETCQGTGYGGKGNGLCPYCWPWDDADMGRNAGLRVCRDPNQDYFPPVWPGDTGYDVWFPYYPYNN